MSKKALMPIREFSNLTGIRKENLRFYDQVGLLSPEVRGDNGYRYYTRRQLNTAFLISDLRILGVGLPEIKQYASERSTKKMIELFAKQDEHIRLEIERLHSIQELMQLHAQMAQMALGYNKDEVIIEEKQRVPIFLCPPVEVRSKHEESYVSSYDYAASMGIDISFPVATIISKEALLNHDWQMPTQHYFMVNKLHNTYKPAGTYVVCYGEDANKLYSLIMNYIETHHLTIIGDAYEEYLLDELSVHEGENYGMRIEVLIEKKEP